jgi:hypothetical protein
MGPLILPEPSSTSDPAQVRLHPLHARDVACGKGGMNAGDPAG